MSRLLVIWASRDLKAGEVKPPVLFDSSIKPLDPALGGAAVFMLLIDNHCVIGAVPYLPLLGGMLYYVICNSSCGIRIKLVLFNP